MLPYLETDYGNPNSVHQEGTRTRAAIEKARGIIARALGALPSEITFTGSGTESNNHAILGTILSGSLSGNIVMSAVEHASVATTVQWTAKKFGLEMRIAPFRYNENGVDPAPFLELIDQNTRLVTVMTANNETGVLMPIREIFAAAKQIGAVLPHGRHTRRR